MTTYRFKRNVKPAETPARLPFKKGETIEAWSGHDYGCCADDAQLGGIESVALTMPNADQFFTCSVALLEHLDGSPVTGPYAHVAAAWRARHPVEA